MTSYRVTWITLITSLKRTWLPFSALLVALHSGNHENTAALMLEPTYAALLDYPNAVLPTGPSAGSCAWSSTKWFPLSWQLMTPGKYEEILLRVSPQQLVAIHFPGVISCQESGNHLSPSSAIPFFASSCYNKISLQLKGTKQRKVSQNLESS